jgi:hypothetical protein
MRPGAAKLLTDQLEKNKGDVNDYAGNSVNGTIVLGFIILENR